MEPRLNGARRIEAEAEPSLGLTAKRAWGHARRPRGFRQPSARTAQGVGGLLGGGHARANGGFIGFIDWSLTTTRNIEDTEKRSRERVRNPSFTLRTLMALLLRASVFSVVEFFVE